MAIDFNCLMNNQTIIIFLLFHFIRNLQSTTINNHQTMLKIKENRRNITNNISSSLCAIQFSLLEYISLQGRGRSIKEFKKFTSNSNLCAVVRCGFVLYFFIPVS